MTCLTWWLAVAVGLSMQDAPKDAVALGRTRDAALYGAFHAGYALAPAGEIGHAEVITEFRRAVLIVRQHADLGEYSFNENNLAREMKAYRGRVAFVVEVRLHPLHTYSSPPLYDIYVRTGPTTPPVALTGLKREPVYPPGFYDTSPGFTSFRLEGSVAREAIAGAEEPALVVTNDRGAVIWQARLDLTRFR